MLIALVLMVILTTVAKYTFNEFGFKWPDHRNVAWAVFAGIPIALIVAGLDHRFGSAGPLAGLKLPLITALVLFGVCAPIQEEIIFRGLIQTAAARNCVGMVMVAGKRVSYAVLIAATLFGLVHLEVAVFTAVAAFVFGVWAGELRRRSGSLLPAFILHTLFNAASFLWMAPK